MVTVIRSTWSISRVAKILAIGGRSEWRIIQARMVTVEVAVRCTVIIVMSRLPQVRRWRIPVLERDQSNANQVTQARELLQLTLDRIGDAWLRNEDDLLVQDEAGKQAPRGNEELGQIDRLNVSWVRHLDIGARRAKNDLRHRCPPRMQWHPGKSDEHLVTERAPTGHRCPPPRLP